ncbi:MAG: hypothetical protein WDO68_18780 [Gammaproteobacteria bacterium]
MPRSIHYIAGSLLLICAQCALPALADTATAGVKAQCESRAPEFDGKVTCTFLSSGADQRFAFKARFLGSHDDTTMSMTAALNQQPLSCEPGSKMSSRFEDGEITLECRFSVNTKAGSKQTLEMNIEWSHAQYADSAFTAL